jgi:adenylate cyclase
MSQITTGHCFLGEYDVVVMMAGETIRSYPDHPSGAPHRSFAAALGQLGRLGEAQEALQKAIVIAPKAFDMFVRHRVSFVWPEDHEHILEGLRKAGWEGWTLLYV